LILAAVLLVALLVAKTCGSTETKLGQDEAVAIARQAVTFEPNLVQVRFIKRGFQSRPYWAVSLSQRQPDGRLENVTVIVIDATTGDITEVRKGA